MNTEYSTNIKLDELIPSLKKIRDDYCEVICLLKELKTKKDILDFGNKYHVSMEINYDIAEEFDDRQPILVIRCESWKKLSYVCYYINNQYEPIFDVWCPFSDCDFIDSATESSLNKDYVYAVNWLWHQNITRKDDLFKIIHIMRLHGIEYNELINKYEFDSEIVEEYENNHYELGYGDDNVFKGNVYYDNNLEPLADDLVLVFSKFLENKGIAFFNDDSDEHQLNTKTAIYGEDFRTLQEMIQTELDKHIKKESE